MFALRHIAEIIGGLWVCSVCLRHLLTDYRVVIMSGIERSQWLWCHAGTECDNDRVELGRVRNPEVQSCNAVLHCSSSGICKGQEDQQVYLVKCDICLWGWNVCIKKTKNETALWPLERICVSGFMCFRSMLELNWLVGPFGQLTELAFAAVSVKQVYRIIPMIQLQRWKCLIF